MEVLLMKRWATMIAIAAICAVSAGELFAGSIDYLSNQSADYVRTFSRSASTDADAVIYNPAGTGFMKPGIIAQISGQTIFKTYSNTLVSTGKEYKSTEPTPFIPSLSAVYKAENWAAFGAFSIVAGGGTVKYKDGIPTMVSIAAAYGQSLTSGTITADSVYYGFTLGGSYSINSMISVSLGARYITSEKAYKGSATLSGGSTLDLDAKESAQGIGGIFGVDVRPIDGLLIALRYEMATPLKYKTSTGASNSLGAAVGFTDGEKRRKDLPAMFSAGASYTLDKLTVTSSFDGFLIGMSDQKSDVTTGTPAQKLYVDGYDDDYKSFGWEWSFSVEYAVIPEFLKLSTGYMHTVIGGNKDTYNDFDFSLDSNTFCLGGRLTAMQGLDLIFGGSTTIYKSSKNATESVNYKKSAYVIAYGVEYKM
jgi:long-chain fatty acid transport protein